jgi:hypothetical protein
VQRPKIPWVDAWSLTCILLKAQALVIQYKCEGIVAAGTLVCAAAFIKETESQSTALQLTASRTSPLPLSPGHTRRMGHLAHSCMQLQLQHRGPRSSRLRPHVSSNASPPLTNPAPQLRAAPLPLCTSTASCAPTKQESVCQASKADDEACMPFVRSASGSGTLHERLAAEHQDDLAPSLYKSVRLGATRLPALQQHLAFIAFQP